jgi:hypothetical protein
MTEKFERPEWYQKIQIEEFKKMNERLDKIEADILKRRSPCEPTKAQQNRKLLINATASVVTLSTLAFLAWLSGYNFDSRGDAVAIYAGMAILFSAFPFVIGRD